MASTHPTALVDPSARLGRDVAIGPFCVVGADVTLGASVVLHSHVVVEGHTTIGDGTSIFPFAYIGHRPQDLKFRGEHSTVTIGARCMIREGVTINPGTQDGGLATVVGDRCTLMAQSHVGHDCRVGNDVVLSNNVMLAGHVTIGDSAILGGGVGVHQFVRIGELAFVGGLSGLEGDLIPYGMAMGDRARLVGLNLIGLRRHGVPRDSIRALADTIETLFGSTRDGTTAERIDAARSSSGGDPCVARLLAFVAAREKRPLCRPAEKLRSKDDAP